MIRKLLFNFVLGVIHDLFTSDFILYRRSHYSKIKNMRIAYLFFDKKNRLILEKYNNNGNYIGKHFIIDTHPGNGSNIKFFYNYDKNKFIDEVVNKLKENSFILESIYFEGNDLLMDKD
jgi:hypothetical protein